MYILYKQLKGVYAWFIYLCGSLVLGRTLTWGRWIITMFSPLLSRSPIIVRKNGEQLPSIRWWAISTESWQTSLMSQNLFLEYISEKPVPIHKKCLGLLVRWHFLIWLIWNSFIFHDFWISSVIKYIMPFVTELDCKITCRHNKIKID